jgi:hypothetical protein
VRLGAVIFGIAAVSAASATEVPDRTFFTGNDVYDWCRSDREMAQGYIAGLFDEAAHAAFLIEGLKSCRSDREMAQGYIAGLFDEAAHAAFLIEGLKSKYRGQVGANDDMIDFELNRIVGYCVPERVRVEQVTDVFCNCLRDNPDKRSGLPSIILSDALTRAWPCHGK